ncbi:PREDICTED: TIMELESS-interacting protein [Papilio polytes]|uniref:TIMELESS-interacting protein n=1 Tax=Papilio polytes TaxID=76194 RepID=UPI0006767735|nr:PREDICTED: TIMELESS-interacting protein [Papilio polytes]
MSLLEDIFLRDEADEARELERVIEGDDYDDKPQRSDSDANSEKEDEAEEEKKRVDPSSTKSKRTVRNPRFTLNPARLTGPRGIQVIPDHFKDFKFKGKGHEKEDLDLVLKKLEHWAYRLYPKFEFSDCLKKIETLGKKRPVMVHLQKIRSDQYTTEETVVQKDSSDDEIPVEREEDEFDKLLQQQIELARNTPAPNSVKKNVPEDSIVDRSLFTAPKVTSSPSISDEQRDRMIRNRKLAEERRLARIKNKITENQDITNISSTNIPSNKEDDEIIVTKKHNRTNTIDSSDEELMSMNESVSVDIHTGKNFDTTETNKHIEIDISNTMSENNISENTTIEDNKKNHEKELKPIEHGIQLESNLNMDIE